MGLFSVYGWYENMIGEGPVGIWSGIYSIKETFGDFHSHIFLKYFNPKLISKFEIKLYNYMDRKKK